MSNKLFVGNIEWTTTVDELGQFFSQCGDVEDARIITDRETGKSRGFGFITYIEEKDAKEAVEVLNEQELNGRKIFVNEARDNKE